MGRTVTLLIVFATLAGGCEEARAPRDAHQQVSPGATAMSQPTEQVAASEMPSEPVTTPVAAPAGRSGGTMKRVAKSSCFPLDRGQWVYDLEVVAEGRPATRGTATKQIRDTRRIGDETYTRITTEVTGGGLSPPDQFCRERDDGVYAAVQGAEGKELLIVPRDPVAKATWSGDGLPSIVRFSGTATPGESFAHAELEFKDCLKVRLEMTIVESSLFGRREVPVAFERWFAPGVGLVREIRTVGEPGKANYSKMDAQLKQYVLD